MVDLAKRLVAGKHFRWMPGMRVLHIEGGEAGSVRGTYLSVGAQEGDLRIQWDDYAPRGLSSDWSNPQNFRPHPWVFDYALPDLSDPGTMGCLLALVREAWGRPKLVPYYTALSSGQGWYVADRFCGDEDYPLIGIPCGSEAEALVVALEHNQ